MKINKEIRKTGTFWLPGKPENANSGVLTIKELGIIYLEIINGAFEYPSKSSYEIICGIVNDIYVTLLNCQLIEEEVVLGKRPIRTNWSIETAITNSQADENTEEIYFDWVQLYMEGLNEWFDFKGIIIDWKNQHYPFDRHTIHCTHQHVGVIYKSDDFTVSCDCELLMKPNPQFFYSTLPQFEVDEILLKNKAYFNIFFTNSTGLNKIKEIIKIIHRFMCFAMDSAVSIESIEGFIGLRGSSEMKKISKLFYQTEPYRIVETNIRRSDFLFELDDVQSNPSNIFVKWFEINNIGKNAINLYFSSKFNYFKFIESDFLSIIQGIETLHREVSKEKNSESIMSKGELKNLINEIINICDKKYHQIIREKLSHANEPTLRDRLNSIINEFQELFGGCEISRKIIIKIVDTRNYLTHYDEKYKNRASTGADLVILTIKLEALFQIYLLNILGFSNQLIQKIAEKDGVLQKKLKT